MKTFSSWKTLAVAAASALTVTALLAMPPAGHHHGTDILHFFVRKAMANEGVDAGGAGRVAAAQNQQGNANHQSVGVSVQGLGASTTYQLLALLAVGRRPVQAPDCRQSRDWPDRRRSVPAPGARSRGRLAAAGRS